MSELGEAPRGELSATIALLPEREKRIFWELYWEEFDRELVKQKRCAHDQDQIDMHSACRGPVVMDISGRRNGVS